MVTTSPTVKVWLINGQTFTVCVDALRQPGRWDELPATIRDVALIVAQRDGLYCVYPNRTYWPDRSILLIEAADPAAPADDGGGTHSWRAGTVDARPGRYDFTGEIAKVLDEPTPYLMP